MTSSREEVAGEIQQRMVRFIAGVVLFNHAVSAKVGLGASDSQFMTLLQTYGPMTPRQPPRRTRRRGRSWQVPIPPPAHAPRER